MYIVFAFLSAIFSSLTALLSKKGLKKINPDTAVFLRTVVILLFLWGIVLASGVHTDIRLLNTQNIVFLTLSGLATGASWICYYRALSVGDVNKVVAVDKSSVVLTVLIGIIFLHEKITVFKIIGVLVLTIGIYLMIDKKEIKNTNIKFSWLIYAGLSAVFAALTSIFAKIGLKNINSDLGTALRTCIVLVMAGIIALSRYRKSLKIKKMELSNNELTEELNKTSDNEELSDDKIVAHAIPLKKDKSKYMDFLFLFLSGLTTGFAWLCYFRALNIGEASIVAPIDKSSIVLTFILSFILLKEKIAKKNVFGLLLLSLGVIFVLF